MTLRALMSDLARPVEAATLALVRLDERLARSEPVLADGVRARSDLFEAQALAHLSGELVGLEDLVLHDAGMDIRAPSTGVVRAARVLTERRGLARRGPEIVLAPDAICRLIGVAESDHKANGSEGDTATDEVRVGVPPRPTSPRPWEMPKPFDDNGLWPDEDDIDDGDGLELLDDEEGEPFASDRSRTATGDFAAVDTLLARTGRILNAIERPLPETAPFRLRDPDYGASARLMAWLGALKAAEDVYSATIWVRLRVNLDETRRSSDMIIVARGRSSKRF